MRGKRLVISAVLILSIFVSPAGLLPAGAQGGGVVHVVEWGESLSGIAEQYGVPVESIMQANSLEDDFIYAGQRLEIPSPSYAEQASYEHEYGNEAGAVAETTYYEVQPGDTLSGIAWQYGISTDELARANDIYNPEMLYSGQRLAIPGGTVAYEQQPPQPIDTGGGFHVVQAGDTLSGIAMRYDTTTWAIVQANNLPDASFIWIGQRLAIPSYVEGYDPAAQVAPSYAPGYDWGVEPQPADVAAPSYAWDGDPLLGGEPPLPSTSVEAWDIDPLLQDPPPEPTIAPAQGETLAYDPLLGDGPPPDNFPPPDPSQLDPLLQDPTPTPIPPPTPTPEPVAVAQAPEESQGEPGQVPETGQTTTAEGESPPAPTPTPVPPQDIPENPPPPIPNEEVATVSPPEFGIMIMGLSRTTSSTSQWEGIVTDNTCKYGSDSEYHRSTIQVVVNGYKGVVVDLKTMDGQTITSCKTGDKPELGQFGCEFAALGGGLYQVKPQGLGGILINVLVDGDGWARAEFTKKG